LNAGIIGCGNMGCLYGFDKGRDYIFSYADLFSKTKGYRLKIIFDIDKRKKKFAKLFNADFSTDVADINRIDYPLDVVAIATPAESHIRLLEFLITKTNIKSIIVEKPTCLSDIETNYIDGLARRHNVKIVVNLFRRFDNLHNDLYQDYFEKLSLGTPLTGSFFYSKEFKNSGFHLIDLLLWWFKDIKIVFSSGGKYPHVVAITKKFQTPIYISSVKTDQFFTFDFNLFFEKGRIDLKEVGFEALVYRTAKFKYASDYTTLKLERNLKSDMKFMRNMLHFLANHQYSGFFPCPTKIHKLIKKIERGGSY